MSRSALVLGCLMVAVAALGGAQQQDVRSKQDLEHTLAERAGINVSLPNLGYFWDEQKNFSGDRLQGSLDVVHTKVIYHLLHWGPQEVEAVTEDYARLRIPKLWPSEELEVTNTAPAIVAGHPAVYAEAMPKKQFYRAFFLIWNCPESGRQFIADMNYNVTVNTPRSELETEIAVTRRTLACHDGAPVSDLVDRQTVLYANPRYGISLRHPVDWFVFDNPYGVPLPAYRGVRNRQIGSILAWMQDMEVKLRFEWSPLPETEPDAGSTMGIPLDVYRRTIAKMLELEGVDDFAVEEYEMIRFGAMPLFKMVGIADLAPAEKKGLGQSPKARVMMLVGEDEEHDRLMTASVLVDFYRRDGRYFAPDRSIFDNWAVDIADALELAPVDAPAGN